MKIKTKLSFNMWFSLASIIFVYVVMAYGANKTKQYEALSVEIIKIDQTLLEMRMEEKSLYMPGDTEASLNLYENKVEKITTFLAHMHNKLDNLEDINQEIIDLEVAIQKYEQAVMDTHEILKETIGDVGSGGLRDQVINDYTLLEKKLSGNSLVLLLKMFQSEILYERGLDPYFMKEWEKHYKSLYVLLSAENRKILNSYRTNYRKIASHLLEVGANDQEGLKKIKKESVKEVGKEAEDIYNSIAAYGAEQLRVLDMVVGWFILIAILNIGVLSTLVQRVILNSIDIVSDIIDKIENEKNMTLRVKLKIDDEMGFISDKLNNMMLAFQETLKEVSQTIDVIQLSCTKLNTSIEISAEDTKKQLLQTDMVATAATEMVSTINEISSHTVKMNNLTKHSNTVAVKGQDDVKKIVVLINKLAENLNAASGDVQQLADDSVSIGSVLNVISEIAEQTNLLALNAAIEAARAGEQGRGFAVVADEVRGLAGKTQEATTEISNIIEKLQASTDNIVDVVVQSQKESEECSAQSENTGKILQEIAQSVTSLSDMSQTVSAAVEEQSVVSAEIGENMVSIRDLANNSNNASQQNAIATQELQFKANELFEKISAFKL